MKVKAKYFREIEYVEVKDLPKDQQVQLAHYKEADYIKILIDDKVVGPCLQYSHYETWYNAVQKQNISKEIVPQSLPVKELAVNKL